MDKIPEATPCGAALVASVSSTSKLKFNKYDFDNKNSECQHTGWPPDSPKEIPGDFKEISNFFQETISKFCRKNSSFSSY